MPFRSNQEVEQRLLDPSRLEPREIRDLIEWMGQISERGMRRLNIELSLQNLDAVQRFEHSSSSLTKWLIGLTIALVILTVVVAGYTVQSLCGVAASSTVCFKTLPQIGYKLYRIPTNQFGTRRSVVQRLRLECCKDIP